LGPLPSRVSGAACAGGMDVIETGVQVVEEC
jgi:hypothetical protein